MKPKVLPARIGSSARSIPRNARLTGTTESSKGNQEYNFPDRPAKFSGVNGNTPLIAQKSPMNIGIWITKGPKHPTGLTPVSL